MTNVPSGPWTIDAQAIGPLQKVCPISSGASGLIAGLVLLFLFLSPVLLGLLAFATCAAVQPGLSDGLSILSVFAFFWVVLCLGAIVCGIVVARKRLLLGERGLALWTPFRTRLILWDDLGSAWRYVPLPAHTDQPLTVVLEHSSGARVAITSEFEDHHQVALRVIEELERRSPGREPGANSGTTSVAIQPAQREITELPSQNGSGTQ
jgi:hypothetical protein